MNSSLGDIAVLAIGNGFITVAVIFCIVAALGFTAIYFFMKSFGRDI